MFVEAILDVKNDVIHGQASLAKMMPIRGKLTTLVCHLTKKVNKAEYLTYLSRNIELNVYGSSILYTDPRCFA